VAAANTDKLKKSYSFLSKSLNGGINDSVLTLALNNTTNVPTDTAVDCIIDRVDANGNLTPSAREIITGVVSGSNLISLVRGRMGTTAQSHSSGAVVEFVVSAQAHNDMVDWGLVEHNQAGTHAAITATSLSATGAVSAGGTLSATGATTLTGALTIKSYDGWIAPTDTWTYASATTFTISGVDRTAQFIKGAKLKLTQTSVKYFYVISSTFSTNTTVTVWAGTDYTLANAAITSPNISYDETPQGFPQYFTSPPTYTNLTSTSGTDTSRFKISGQEVTFEQCLVFGASTTMGSDPRFTLPVTAATYSVATIVGRAMYQDTGTKQFLGDVVLLNTTTANFLRNITDSTDSYTAALNASNPHAWASTDIITCVIRYKMA
jgi:hypothetical protein